MEASGSEKKSPETSIFLFMPWANICFDFGSWEGSGVSGGVSTPGHGQGEGPDGYKFPLAGTQETLGGAGAKRSPPGTLESSEPKSVCETRPSGGDNVPRGTREGQKMLSLSAEINQENGDIGGGDTGDAGGLGDGGWAIALEFLATLDRERLHLVKVEIRRNLDILQAIVLLGLLLFTVDIAGVLDGNLDGLHNLR